MHFCLDTISEMLGMGIYMKKVLVVDDTKNIRNLLRTCLEIEDYEVITAVDGKQAIELITQQEFNLIFLDIKLPELSGTEVLRRVRAMKINVPVIIMTAFATVKNAVDCTKMGAVAYLQKPFTADKVKNLLQELSITNVDDVENINSYFEFSLKLIDEHKYEEAYEYLKLALSQNPNDDKIYKLLGDVMKELGRSEEADKFYKTAQVFESGK